MIKIEHLETCGWEAAIRGMRNPKNSWDRSDSRWKEKEYWGVAESIGTKLHHDDFYYAVGENDHDLMSRLRDGGPVHAKYRRMITVYCDITAPLYWWKEMSTYKVGVTVNSCSTMHKLLSKPFEMNDFSFDKLPGYKNEVMQAIPVITEDMLADEAWVPCDRDYDVSCYGRVRRRVEGRYRIISGTKHSDGYLYTNIHGEQLSIHRLVAEYFHPDTQREGFVVNHIDGNKLNNFAENLEWVTQKENIRHSYNNHLQPNAVKTYTGKFTKEQRDQIKSLWDEGSMSKRQIAKKYGVSHTCINDIINDKYAYADKVNLYEEIARPLVDTLNELRDAWCAEIEPERKRVIWYSIVQLLPSSYNQRRTVELNYEVLAGMYKWRKDHKLDEWREFCRVMKNELPESWLFTGEEE